MHRSISGHDWDLVLDDSVLPFFRWRCVRCGSVVQASKRPQRNRQIHFQSLGKDHRGLSCDEVVAYRVLQM